MAVRASLSRISRWWREGFRVRMLGYALIISIFCGTTGLLEPLDDAIRNFRYRLREVPADGSIIIVGIDQASVDALGGEWPWPRANYAKIISELKKLGANKIVFDKSLSNKNSDFNDKLFIETVKRYYGTIYLGVGLGEVSLNNPDGLIKPFPALRKYVMQAGYKVRFNPLGQVDQVYTYLHDGLHVYPSISAVLSEKYLDNAPLIRPDFAIRPQTFPYISASDLILGRPLKLDVRGKDVLLGDAAMSLGDMKFLPGQQGLQPGLYVHAIAAQTLKSGVPVDLGWFPAWVAGLLVSIIIIFTDKKIWQILISIIVPVMVIGIPVILDNSHISVEISPAILMLAIVAIQNARARLGWRKSRTNETSGLANITALRELKNAFGAAVIAAKIQNYAAICASFPPEVESLIISDIVSRLRLRDDHVEIYQSDDGVFYWISHVDNRHDLGNHLDGLKALFATPLQIGDRRVDVTISFGADLDDSRSVASRASNALVSADEAQRSGQRWNLYDPTRTADAAWQLSLASEIDRAMQAEEFWLAYQPKLNLRTGKIIGAEVLLRWQHPIRGNISPVEFIPAAERHQRIRRLTDYVIDRALSASQLLAADGEYKLAINVSVPILGDPEFANDFLKKCRNAGVSTKRIMVEITESVLMSVDDTQVGKTLQDLREFGFGLSIDDFGTGFSSLEYVRSIPAHEMKIDQSFVKRVLTSAADLVVIESVLRMAHELGRYVVAEGVEDAETLSLLCQLKCDEAQGFYIGRPVDFMSFRARLQKERDDMHSSGRAAA